MIVKRIRPLSLAKVMGSIYGAVGLLFGIIFAFLSLIGAGVGLAASDGGPEALFGLLFGVGAVIFLPLFYGGLAFRVGLLIASIYNLAAARIGGLEVELEPAPTA
ncbi:MAG: hypothetical protein R3325_03140 [Thermoanaerobaculia bacterium]|nr:hypothetical protein [Thermoanaerobaculia bacterium]